MSGFMVEGRRFRWWGDPTEDEQPDAGDILVIHDSDPEQYRLVHGSAQVRGKGPADLWLWVTKAQIGADGSIPDEVYERLTGDAKSLRCVLSKREPRRRKARA